MNTFFYNANQWNDNCVLPIDRSKECAFFMPTQGVDDKEIYESETPEQASAIIKKRMAKAIEEEFSRLKLEI